MRYLPVQIGVRLQPRLKAWLDRQAEVEEVSVSTLVRQWIVEQHKRDLQGKADGSLQTTAHG
jgi:predicted HicB family RNase H-like nuclease